MNPKPDPEYSEAVKQWADEMGAMSKQQPEAFDPKEMKKVQNDIDSVNAGATIDRAKLLNLPDLKQLLFDVQQVMAGYSQDDTWSDWDESVRKRVVNAQYLFESQPTPNDKPEQQPEEVKTDNNLINHIRNVKLLTALYSGKKFFVECFPTDEGAIHFPNSNRAVKEIELPNFDLFEEKLGYRWVKEPASPPTPEGKPLEVVEAAKEEAINRYPYPKPIGDSLYGDAGEMNAVSRERAAFIAGTQWSSGGWISVKKLMPEKNVYVLVTNGEKVKEAVWMRRTDKDEYHFMFTTMKDITHWMPLPSPPITRKEKGEQE